MKCPNCGSDMNVVDSRWLAGERGPMRGQQCIRRRRQCTGDPQHRFTTYETFSDDSLLDRLTAHEDLLLGIRECLVGILSSTIFLQFDGARRMLGMTAEQASRAINCADDYITKCPREGYRNPQKETRLHMAEFLANLDHTLRAKESL